MKTTATKMILGMVVAAAAGAAIGMLLAPEKGTDLQKKVKDGLKTFMDDMTAILGAGKDIVENSANGAEEKLNEVSSNLSRIER
jgi:gas vesicle protein